MTHQIVRNLFKKNYIYWKRNYIGSLLELVLPCLFIIFIALMIGLNPLRLSKFEKYPNQNFATTFDTSKFPKGFEYKKNMKKCKGTFYGGRIGLAPKNDITEKIGSFFTNMEEEVIYFDNDQQIDEYVLSQDYDKKFLNGTRKQLCYAISFNKVDEENMQYEYSLRYNVSNPLIQDHYDTANVGKKVQLVPDFEGNYNSTLSRGPLSTQILIESFLLKKHLDITNDQLSLQKMQTVQYNIRVLKDFDAALVYLLVFAILFSYLRWISIMVDDREQRNLDSLENMGMRKFEYFLALYLWMLLKQIVYGSIYCLFLKFQIFPSTNYLYIYTAYIIFAMNMILIASIISMFFVSSKKALLFGIVCFFLVQIPYIINQSFSKNATIVKRILAISPVASLGFYLQGLLQTETYLMPYQYQNLFQYVYSFKGIDFFIIGLIEMFVFFWLSLYCFYVVKLKFGISSHPLFFLGFSYKTFKQEQQEDLNECLINTDRNESVDSNFLIQKKQKKAIIIQDLRKVYQNGKIAIKNLNLDIFSGQILALLGHNGAGKTTLVSLLSGFINKSSGSIDIFGLDSVKDRKEIRKLIGVCQQQNTIFEFMTVQEHLNLYCSIKNQDPKQFQTQQNQILQDLDLLDKKNYMARYLSGGQKRKLCIAMAFIGNSKIILLDEPTSGMDVYARRLLWDVIKKHKQNRVVLLTTQNMHEADYLGDRIAIMQNGGLEVVGSSMFLKQNFGTGYELTIANDQKFTNEQADTIKKIIQEICPNSHSFNIIGSELKIFLDFKDSENFDKLFEVFENYKQNKLLESYGITLNSLEEVFLKFSEYETDNQSDQETDSYSKNSIDIQSVDYQQTLRLEKEGQIIKDQIRQQIKKRMIYFYRDKQTIFCELFIPIICVAIGIIFSKINFLSNSPSLQLGKGIYPLEFTINDLNERQKVQDIFLNNIQLGDYKAKFTDQNNIEKFDDLLYQQRKESQNYAYFLKQLEHNAFDTQIFYNTTAPFSPYETANIFHNSILRSYSGNKNAYIKMNLYPLKMTWKILSYVSAITAGLFVIFISLGFTFIPVSIVSFLIKERENSFKHLQLFQGGNWIAYWISNFIIDFLKYSITSTICLLLIYFCNIQNLIEPTHLQMTILLFFINGFSIVWFSYFFSFYFVSQTKGQIFLFILSYLFNIVLVVICFGLRMLESTRSISVNILENIFSIMPFFSFSFGLLNMSAEIVYVDIFVWGEYPSAFDFRVSLKQLIFLSSVGVIMMIATFITELKEQKIFKNKNIKEKIQPQIEGQAIEIKSLTKEYDLGQKWQKSQENKKTALKGMDLNIEQGNVFALLGTNGAGKSTTFKILTGQLEPTEGQIDILGYDISQYFSQLRIKIGYCPQHNTLLSKLTVWEHLNLFCSMKGIKHKYRSYLINTLLKDLNLETFRDVQVHYLSGGNKRKIQTAIALLGSPQIVLMDEPSSGMDPSARKQMWLVMNNMIQKQQKTTFVITTHSMEEAEALCNNIAIMVEGKVETIGTLQQLKGFYGNSFEIEIKMKQLSNKQRKRYKDKIETILHTKSKQLSTRQIREILLYYQIQDYDQFDLDCSDYQHLQVIIEKIDVSIKMNKIEKFIHEHFQARLKNQFGYNCIYDIDKEEKMSRIFKIFEQEKRNQLIQAYSVKQLNLEQIFLKVAKNKYQLNFKYKTNQFVPIKLKKIILIHEKSRTKNTGLLYTKRGRNSKKSFDNTFRKKKFQKYPRILLVNQL